MTGRLRRLEWLALLGLLLLAFWLRVWRFTDTPPGVIHDEVRTWFNAQLVLAGDIRALYPYGGGREALFMFLEAVSYALIGDNLLAGRLPAILCNMLGIALSFHLARRLFGSAAGMVAAAGMATSFWALLFSRFAERTGSMPVFALLVACLYLRLAQPRHPAVWHYLMAGMALGLSLYTYPSALIFPLILMAWLAFIALTDPPTLRGNWLPLATTFILAALIAIPLALAWADPAATARASEVRGPLDALLAGDPGPVLANVGPVLGVFSVRGDHGLEFNIQDAPIFPTPLIAALFYAGLLAALVGMFQKTNRQRTGYTLALFWLLGMLIPTLVTERPVNPSRTIGLLGIVYFFPAIAIAAALDLARRTRRDWPRIAIASVGVLALAWQFAYTVPGYFFTWGSNPVVRFLYQDEYRQLGRYLDTHPEPDSVAIGGLTPYEMDPASIRLLVINDDRAATAGYFDPQNSLLVPSGDEAAILIPASVTLHPAFATRLDASGVVPFSPNPAFEGYALKGTWMDAFNPAVEVQVAFQSNDGKTLIRLLGYEITNRPAPDQPFTLLTFWRTVAPTPALLRIFVHVTDADGNILAQSDVLGVPAPQWRDGDLIIQAHDLVLPADALPGPYWINIGLYDPATGIRLTSPDAEPPDYLRQPLP